ncbi:hypothetical protein E2C01_063770 [Portunus trituberculatus]|uniref:Uncharacterized protein n=1 Tax=Portunus trituberculatus TaxID=210409 RepID=A0A5B7HEK0_PORTR|nr:hypothetical protein [Portunus trituberculatus]
MRSQHGTGESQVTKHTANHLTERKMTREM